MMETTTWKIVTAGLLASKMYLGSKKNNLRTFVDGVSMICNLPVLLLRLVFGTACFGSWLADLGQVGTLAGLRLIEA